MEPKYVAAIEIGSSKIKGIVASVDATAGITVLAVEESPTADSVRYGRVQNAREVGTLVDDIIRRLENNPQLGQRPVTAVFVANGGRSLSSSAAEATVRQGADVEVTAQTLERLHKEARYNLATDRDVLAIAPRRYYADNTEVKKIVGSFGNVIRGEFTFITASPENKRNLDRVEINSHGEHIAREYVTRLLAQTEMALTDSDRQLGCVYVDFGAETTTVAVFRDGALQMARTLPMGSSNITRDLCVGLSMTDEAAEHIKCTRGQAMADRINIDAPDAATREIINYVSARAGEIIANINHTVTEAGFKAADLPAGFVISGGGSRLRGFNEMLEQQTRMKVRPAAVDRSIRVQIPGVSAADHFDVIALVKYAAAHSDMNCLGDVPVTAKAEADETAAAAAAAAPATAAARVGQTGRRVIAEDDPALLKDDLDEPLDQPDNINGDDEDDGDDLPKPGRSATETRRKLLEKFKNWFTQPDDDNVDDD